MSGGEINSYRRGGERGPAGRRTHSKNEPEDPPPAQSRCQPTRSVAVKSDAACKVRQGLHTDPAAPALRPGRPWKLLLQRRGLALRMLSWGSGRRMLHKPAGRLSLASRRAGTRNLLLSDKTSDWGRRQLTPASFCDHRRRRWEEGVGPAPPGPPVYTVCGLWRLLEGEAALNPQKARYCPQPLSLRMAGKVWSAFWNPMSQIAPWCHMTWSPHLPGTPVSLLPPAIPAAAAPGGTSPISVPQRRQPCPLGVPPVLPLWSCPGQGVLHGAGLSCLHS